MSCSATRHRHLLKARKHLLPRKMPSEVMKFTDHFNNLCNRAIISSDFCDSRIYPCAHYYAAKLVSPAGCLQDLFFKGLSRSALEKEGQITLPVSF